MTDDKELERIDKMIAESQESLTNATSAADRKNEAAVLKELYAARKGIIDSNTQKYVAEKNHIEKEKEMLDSMVAKNHDRELEKWKLSIEEKKFDLEKRKHRHDSHWRKMEYGLAVGRTIVGVGSFLGACGIAAVATNESWYDGSLIRTAGMIPNELMKGIMRK